MLEIRHLTKQYGEKTAVDDLTLTIRPGEIFGFIGPNGAGKTTTLKCCCGILQPDRGEVRVERLFHAGRPACGQASAGLSAG